MLNQSTFNNDIYWSSHNLVPFKTIIFYLFLADINFNIRIENVVGNIIGFVPLGFILPLLSTRFKEYKMIMLSSFLLSLSIELAQFVLKIGSFDVDDLILNTFGGIVGYFIYYLFIYYRKLLKI